MQRQNTEILNCPVFSSFLHIRKSLGSVLLQDKMQKQSVVKTEVKTNIFKKDEREKKLEVKCKVGNEKKFEKKNQKRKKKLEMK